MGENERVQRAEDSTKIWILSFNFNDLKIYSINHSRFSDTVHQSLPPLPTGYPAHPRHSCHPSLSLSVSVPPSLYKNHFFGSKSKMCLGVKWDILANNNTPWANPIKNSSVEFYSTLELTNQTSHMTDLRQIISSDWPMPASSEILRWNFLYDRVCQSVLLWDCCRSITIG